VAYAQIRFRGARLLAASLDHRPAESKSTRQLDCRAVALGPQQEPRVRLPLALQAPSYPKSNDECTAVRRPSMANREPQCTDRAGLDRREHCNAANEKDRPRRGSEPRLSDKAMLNMTVAQLKAGADFKYAPDPAAQTESASQGLEQRSHAQTSVPKP